MQLGIGLPNALAPAINRGLLLDWARVADQAGFHTFGTLDHPAYEGWDPLVALAAAAAVTERVRLATTSLLLPMRNELQVAMQVAAIDRLSGGRVDLGVSVGGRESDYAAMGVKMKGRGRKLDRQIRKMRRSWRAAKKATGSGVVSESGPAPLQKALPSIWIGGGVEASYERAIKLGDGYMFGGGASVEHVAATTEMLRARATEAKKRRFQIVALKYCALGDADTLENAAKLTERYYGGLWAAPEELFLHGGADEVLAGAKAYEATGVDLLILIPQVPDVRQVEAIGTEVLPAFRIPGR